MPYDVKLPEKEEDIVIDVNEDYHITFWTNELHVSEQELKDAVSLVGPFAKDVKKYFPPPGSIANLSVCN